MARETDVLAFIDWVWGLQWRAGLDLAAGDASFDEIAASVGVEAPRLAPGDLLGSDLGNAQLYWPGSVPSAVISNG